MQAIDKDLAYAQFDLPADRIGGVVLISDKI